jgi:hypothetical protein
VTKDSWSLDDPLTNDEIDALLAPADVRRRGFRFATLRGAEESIGGWSWTRSGCVHPGGLCAQVRLRVRLAGWATKDGRRLMENTREIEGVDLATLRRLFTSWIRGDRFCDGALASAYESGAVRCALDRLEVLRRAM